MTTALELLKNSATIGYVGNGNAVDKFYNRVAEQIALIEQVKTGKEVSTRSLWFKKANGVYEVRIGRSALEIAGSKLFKADDLDGVIAVLKAAVEVVKSDDKLQAVITKHAEAKSAQLKAGRKPRTKK